MEVEKYFSMLSYKEARNVSTNVQTGTEQTTDWTRASVPEGCDCKDIFVTGAPSKIGGLRLSPSAQPPSLQPGRLLRIRPLRSATRAGGAKATVCPLAVLQWRVLFSAAEDTVLCWAFAWRSACFTTVAQSSWSDPEKSLSSFDKRLSWFWTTYCSVTQMEGQARSPPFVISWVQMPLAVAMRTQEQPLSETRQDVTRQRLGGVLSCYWRTGPFRSPSDYLPAKTFYSIPSWTTEMKHFQGNIVCVNHMPDRSTAWHAWQTKSESKK